MDKQSLIEMQKIDCNCNDCKFMDRDNEKYNHSKTLHHLWQRQYFDMLLKKKIDRADYWLKNNEWQKSLLLIEEVNRSKFAFNNDAHISFGRCNKFDKEITFIANTCQLETQECFEHRKVIN